MTDITLPGTAPRHFYAGHIATSTRATYVTDADLINPSANVLAMPNCPITVLNAGAFTPAETFFGLSIKYQVNYSATGITANTVRSHDIADGMGRWDIIQPTTSRNLGTWRLTALDAWVDYHYAAGRDLVFTFFGTPTVLSARPTEDTEAVKNAYASYIEGVWYNRGIAAEPGDMADWDFYCTTIATRYAGKIKYYEVLNEPNYNNNGTAPTGTGFFFSGTWAKLAEMVRRANQAVKAVDPTAKIICPPVQGWTTTSGLSDTYFTGMMSAATGDGSTTMKDWVDIVGVHMYTPSNLKDLPGIIDRVTASKAAASVSGLETWDTESAPIGSTQEVAYINDPAACNAIPRRMVICAAKGVARSIYYQYDHPTMGFLGRQAVIDIRERVIADLLSGTVTGASMFTDGRVVYSCSGGQYVI